MTEAFCAVFAADAAVDPREIAQSRFTAQSVLIVGNGSGDDAAASNVVTIDDNESAGGFAFAGQVKRDWLAGF